MTMLKLAEILLLNPGVQPRNQNNFANVRLAFTCLILTSVAFLSVFEVVINWESIESLGKAEIVPVFLKNLLTLVSYAFSKNSWESILRNINTKFWNSDAFDIEFSLKQSSILLSTTRFVKFYLFTLSCASIIFFIKPAFEGELPYFIYLFCDTTHSACYIGIYLFETFANVIHVLSVLGFDILLIYLVTKVYCELEAIKYRLKKIDCGGRTDIIEEEIRVLLEHHAFVLCMVEKLRKLWTYIFLFQYWSSTISICFGFFLMNINGIPPTLNYFMRYSSFLSAFIIQLSIYCLAGTVVMQQSTSISKAAFEVNWWIKTQPNIRKSLALMIQRANKPGVLDIGGIEPMCMEVFPQILRTAFSFFTLMKNLERK